MRSATAETDLCNLPITILVSDKSARQVVVESGVKPEQLNLQSISAALLAKPSLIENWLRYSESKRVAQGWYFMRDQHIYVVGFHPRGEKKIFEYPIEACADFIVKEISAIQRTLSRGPAI